MREINRNNIIKSDEIQDNQTWNECWKCGNTWKDEISTPGLLHRTVICEDCIEKNIPKRPIAILTDDYVKAFRQTVSDLGNKIQIYSVHRKEIMTKDEWYVFITKSEELKGLEIKDYRVKWFDHNSRELDYWISVAKTRIR